MRERKAKKSVGKGKRVDCIVMSLRGGEASKEERQEERRQEAGRKQGKKRDKIVCKKRTEQEQQKRGACDRKDDARNQKERTL